MDPREPDLEHRLRTILSSIEHARIEADGATVQRLTAERRRISAELRDLRMPQLTRDHARSVEQASRARARRLGPPDRAAEVVLAAKVHLLNTSLGKPLTGGIEGAVRLTCKAVRRGWLDPDPGLPTDPLDPGGHAGAHPGRRLDARETLRLMELALRPSRELHATFTLFPATDEQLSDALGCSRVTVRQRRSRIAAVGRTVVAFQEGRAVNAHVAAEVDASRTRATGGADWTPEKLEGVLEQHRSKALAVYRLLSGTRSS